MVFFLVVKHGDDLLACLFLLVCFLTLAEAYVTLLAIMVVFLTEVIEQLTATANVVGIQIGNHGLYTFDIALLQLVIDGRREL